MQLYLFLVDVLFSHALISIQFFLHSNFSSLTLKIQEELSIFPTCASLKLTLGLITNPEKTFVSPNREPSGCLSWKQVSMSAMQTDHKGLLLHTEKGPAHIVTTSKTIKGGGV